MEAENEQPPAEEPSSELPTELTENKDQEMAKNDEPQSEQNGVNEVKGDAAEIPQETIPEEQPQEIVPEELETSPVAEEPLEKSEYSETVTKAEIDETVVTETVDVSDKHEVTDDIVPEGTEAIEETVVDEIIEVKEDSDATTDTINDPEKEKNEDMKFVGEIVSTIFSDALGQAGHKSSEEDFIVNIVEKLVSRAVGEKSTEDLKESIALDLFKQDAEDVTGRDIMKYLLGPESLRMGEEAWKPEYPATCVFFLNVVEYARKFVEDILETAKELCLTKYGVPVKYCKKQVEIQNIRWPSIENFTIELGFKKIHEYIQMTFEVEENWMYTINFIAAQSDLSSDVYLYEAIFCIPTPCYPIAQSTVSVYFNCEVSRVKPRECPIDVTYTIESLRETLVPGKTVVNDDMLLRLVYSKLSVFKSVFF